MGIFDKIFGKRVYDFDRAIHSDDHRPVMDKKVKDYLNGKIDASDFKDYKNPMDEYLQDLVSRSDNSPRAQSIILSDLLRHRELVKKYLS